MNENEEKKPDAAEDDGEGSIHTFAPGDEQTPDADGFGSEEE